MSQRPRLDPGSGAFNQVFDVSPEPVAIVVDGQIVYANQALADLVSAESPSTLEGTALGAFLEPGQQAPSTSRLGDLLARQDGQEEVELVDTHDRILHVEVSGLPVSYRGEDAFLLYLDDVTHHRKVERSLRNALSMHRTTLESASEGILVVDNDGEIASYNSRFQEIWELPDEVMATGDPSLALDEAIERVADQDTFQGKIEALYDSPTEVLDDEIELADGRVLEWHSRPRMLDGEIVGRVSTFRDITGHQAAKSRLEHAASLAEAAVEATADGVVVLGLDGEIRTYNDQFREMWGFEPQQLDGAHVEEAIGHVLDQVQKPQTFQARVEELLQKPGSDDRLVLELEDGRLFERYSRPQRIDGEVVGRVITFRDVTGWRKAEAALERRVERTNLRAEVSRAVTAHLPDYEPGLEIAAKKVADTLGDACLVRLLSGEGDALRLDAFHHADDAITRRFKDGFGGSTLDPDESLFGPVVSEGVRLHLAGEATEDLAGKLQDAYHPYIEEVGISSLIAVPIRAHGVRLGALAVARDEGHQAYSEEDLAFVQDLADRMGLAISNGRLFREAQDELGRREAAEEALRESERAFRSLFENAPIGIYRTTPDGEVLLANPTLREMLGIDQAAELHERDLGEEFEPEYSRDAFKRRLEEEGAVHGLESTWTLSDGSEIHVRESARAIEDANGEIRYYEGTIEDISARVEIEAALREQRDLYASLLRAQSDLNEGMMIADSGTGSIIYANDAYTRITGYSDEELADLDSFLSTVVPEERERLLELMGPDAREGDLHAHFTTRLEHVSGEERWVEGSITQMESRGTHLLIALVRDITDRKEAEAALGETAERLAEAQRVADLGSWEVDLDTGETRWSREMFRIFGLEPTPDRTLQIEDVLDVVHPEDRGHLEEVARMAIDRREPYDLDHRVVLPGGEVRWVHGQGEVEVDDQGRATLVRGTAQDITERKQAEAKIRRLNEELEERVEERTHQLKLANRELEAFSYSVSHDLQAPLQTINGFTKIVLDEHSEPLDEEATYLLERVRAASRSMERLIKALLDLSRVTQRQIQEEPVDLTRLAQDVARRYQEFDPGREVEVEVDQGMTASGDPKLLEVLLDNLIGNAWKFTKGEELGHIHIGRETEDGEAVFFVADNGTGFDPQHADKLFTPFQRLHDEGFDGTGIGLATVQRIVARHGGDVWATGEVDNGATFRFTL